LKNISHHTQEDTGCRAQGGNSGNVYPSLLPPEKTMKKLTITTIRKFSDEDYKEYKNQMYMIPIDWKELEKTGKTEYNQAHEGEDVVSVYTLEEI